MQQIDLTQLAKRLNLTGFDEPEAYILTPEEEAEVISHHAEILKKRAAWKMASGGLSEMEIMQRLSQDKYIDQVDREAVLNRANLNKHSSLWHNAQDLKRKQQEAARKKEIEQQYTARTFYGLMVHTAKQQGKDLLVNESTKPLITTICFFMSRDNRFETELNYSLNKGLLIRGISGLGKTFLIECIKDNELQPVKIFSMLDISTGVRNEGEFKLPLDGTIVIYLDDVGTEEATVNRFGTKVNFFKEFIEKYYISGMPFNKLIISTNNSFDELQEKYGFRVRSRMKDMFNIINVTGKDLRG